MNEIRALVEVAPERAHHPYNPSSLQDFEACPPFRNRIGGPTHSRTTAGVRGHGMTDSRVDDNRLEDKDALAAAECLDLYDRRKAIMQDEYEEKLARCMERDLQTFAEGGPYDPLVGPQITELKESYLPIDDLVFDDAVATTAGYMDRVFISHDGTYAEAFDWKFGKWPVEKAENNLQGIAYSLGLFYKYPRLERVRFWFKQPHLEYITDAIFTREMIPALYLRVQIVVARAREARKQSAAGDWSMARPYTPVCLFCANIAKCDKVAEKMLNVAHKFSPLDIPANVTPSLLRDPEHSALMEKAASVAAVWSKAVRTQIADQVIRGAVPTPTGFKIQTRADRDIVDRAKYKVEALQFLTPDEYESTLTPSLTAAEEIISTNAPRMHKGEKVQEFKDQLELSGAVVKGTPYSFLRAVAQKEKTEPTE